METVIRVVIIYVLVVAGLRVLGKREFSQLTPLELVMLLLVPEIAAPAISREDYSLTGVIIAVASLFSLTFLNSLLSHYVPLYQKIVSSNPTVLVSHGEFVSSHMNKERISTEEVYGAMHKVGLYDVKQVRWAVLESDGRISIVPEAPPPTLPSKQHSIL